ncbi:MAG: hypothetical protein AB1586_16465 [Pseudomonadota bacterium]
MTDKPSTPEQSSRTDKQQAASAEAAKALAEYELRAIAVRQNMERLRALRLAKEAEEAARAPAAPARKRAASSRGVKGKAESAKESAKTKSVPLSQWLASQRESGRSS